MEKAMMQAFILKSMLFQICGIIYLLKTIGYYKILAKININNSVSNLSIMNEERYNYHD